MSDPKLDSKNDTDFILKGSKDTHKHTQHDKVYSFGYHKREADKVLSEYMDKWCTTNNAKQVVKAVNKASFLSFPFFHQLERLLFVYYRCVIVYVSVYAYL